MKKWHISMVVLACSLLANGAAIKIATIRTTEDNKISGESVDVSESPTIVNSVTEAILASTNTTVALQSRGDNSWSVSPFGIKLDQIKPDQGGGGIDIETGEYHFTVSRYWFDLDAEIGPEGLPQDYIVATLSDTTFNNKDAVATWNLYLSGTLFGTVSASIGVYSIDFGGGVIATLNPVEQVVYSAELENKMEAKIMSVTNKLSNVAFTGDYNSLQNTPDYEIRAVDVGGKLVYKLFLTNPNKE